MRQTVTLMKKNDNEELYMEVGSHVFLFKFDLPAQLPTTFYHEIGKVTYSLNATIDIPW